MDPFKVAAKKIDTVLGADVRSPGADPKKARRLVAESRRGDTVANPYHDSPFTGGDNDIAKDSSSYPHCCGVGGSFGDFKQ
jgi:hypothetical protein